MLSNAKLPRRVGTLAFLAGAAVVLAGCAGGGSSADETATESAPAGGDAAAIAASEAEQAQAGEQGPFAVGHRTITVTDDSRDGRTFEADIWYPSDPSATAGVNPTDAVNVSGMWNRGSTEISMITASTPIAQCAPCSRYT